MKAMGAVMVLKRLSGIRQVQVPPLVVLGLADLMLVTDGGNRLALEAFDHAYGGRLVVPCARLYGGPPEVSATVYAVPGPLSSRGVLEHLTIPAMDTSKYGGHIYKVKSD